MRVLSLSLLLLLGASPVYAACPSSPRVGQIVSLSGTVGSADALMIFVTSCKVGVSVQDDSWVKKCAPGKSLSATGVYRETPLPFSPIPNISEVRKLSCGDVVIR